MASSRRRALGAGWTNRRQAERGRLRGSLRATPLRRKIRAGDAGEGASSPIERILSCTEMGPWSSPEDSSALRTARARRTISWPIRVGLDAGRVERGSRAAAGPSDPARARIA